jgi:glycosyltransferase involved in cell wall biosynthesis
MNPIKIAFLTTDNREQFADYDNPNPHFGTAPTALLEGFSLLGDQVEIHVVSCSKKKIVSPAKLAPNIWFHQPLVPKIGWGRTLFQGCVRAVRRLMNEIQPDIVHGQGTERDCALAAVFSGYPNVLTIHGHMARIAEIINARFPSYYWLATQLERTAIRRTDGVIALTHYTKARVENHAKSIWVLPNAVDAEFFKVENHPEPRLALCVAGIHPWKRQVELMESLGNTEPALRPYLVFLGQASDSEYGLKFQRMIKANASWCEHHGHIGRDELRSWLSKASILILPSIEDNCPMVIIEAMAAGVPAAAARIGGIPDLIQEGINGVLFDPRDADEMAAQIISLIASQTTRDTLAQRCKPLAHQRYRPEVIAEEHLKIYREVLGR